MQLPTIVVPEYDLTLPLSKKKLKYRPFLSKEEKILLMAVENFGETEEDTNSLLNAVMKIAQNCVLTQNIDVNELPTVDLEYLFLNIRKKSVGETIELNIRHNANDCNGRNKVEVNLDTTKIIYPDEHSNKIKINETSGLVLKYPTVNASLSSKIKDASRTETFYNFIINSIDTIYDGDSFDNASNFDQEQLKNWIDTLPTEVLHKIFAFFDSMPYLETKIEYKCEKCGQMENMTIKGTADFFT